MTSPGTAAWLKIRKRERVHSSPPAGMDQSWTEYQVMLGGKILARRGTMEEAEKFIADEIAKAAGTP